MPADADRCPTMAAMAATSRIRSDEQPAQLGLRERKKLKTRVAIRGAAYRLISEQGYEATSVEQIAEAAEVSPSTVFRYFPAKEDAAALIPQSRRTSPLPHATPSPSGSSRSGSSCPLTFSRP